MATSRRPPTKKSDSRSPRRRAASDAPRASSGSAKSTQGGPSKAATRDARDAKGALGTLATAVKDTLAGAVHPTALALERKRDGADDLARAMPFNATKPAEHGAAAARAPVEGAHTRATDPMATASTITETEGSPKTGEHPANGVNRTIDTLDRLRVDATDRRLTTNQGVAIADNQNSLKAGLRGPTLLEDFILREKITHFDHERIPERVVHARGSGAHGYFECYDALTDVTRAAPFAATGKRTPVFVRFSTVAGERGSADTVRDVRGFAVKFYTDEGVWDLVGNNIPVFFIQDAMKFPDLVHSVKPEPHHQMPQASSAHDTFWDFVSLTPESTHMLMWQMSDRAIPRSYRTMQGFGVHTFRLINAEGRALLCKFHWTPLAGTHSLVWDEAVKIAGADPDFHRRDLWEAIESGEYPQYELGLQLFTEEDAERFTFDVLDATKIVPEELVPVRPVGKLVLNRNPDNFFAETEQVAFCAAHVVPGIDFANDPLLHGRIHSYIDTQLTRLGGPNFHEIPINAPLAQVHNNQRDGLHRQAIHRGRVAYEPNSLAGGCPFQAGMSTGFVSFPAPTEGSKLRGKPEKFADHYTQATLFWESQSDIEREHIARAFRFELTRVQTPAIRERVVSMLANVSADLAGPLAAALGIATPAPMPRALPTPVTPEITRSERLSLFAFPGETGMRARRVAILLGEGADARAVASVHRALADRGVVARYVGAMLGAVATDDGEPLPVEITIEAAPSVLWDALVIASDATGVSALVADGHALEFVREQYRHCKAMLAIGGASELLEAAEIPLDMTDEAGNEDAALIVAAAAAPIDASIEQFVAALARHRNFARETDPPLV